MTYTTKMGPFEPRLECSMMMSRCTDPHALPPTILSNKTAPLALPLLTPPLPIVHHAQAVRGGERKRGSVCLAKRTPPPRPTHTEADRSPLHPEQGSGPSLNLAHPSLKSFKVIPVVCEHEEVIALSSFLFSPFFLGRGVAVSPQVPRRKVRHPSPSLLSPPLPSLLPLAYFFPRYEVVDSGTSLVDAHE